MSTPGPQHELWADAVGSYLLDALPPEERDGFVAHLQDCPVCRNDVEELALAAEALPLSVPAVAPPPALKDRIMTIVESEAELLAAAGDEADAPRRAPARVRRGFLGGLLMRPAVALACAAVLLVVGGVVGAVLSGGGDEERTVVAQTTAPRADVRMEIRDDRGTLVARGMPAPPPGRLYQVWLKRPGVEAPEPTSVLWSTRNGSADVVVPGTLDDVEAVLVTREPRRGSETPSESPVITVPLA